MGEVEETETAKQEISMNKSSEIVSKLEKEGIFQVLAAQECKQKRSAISGTALDFGT